MTEMQRQFEEWAIGTKDQVGLPLFIIKNESGKYVDHATEVSWKAWQASRAAVVVKLPEPEFRDWVSYETIEGYKAAIDEVKYALDDAEVNYED